MASHKTTNISQTINQIADLSKEKDMAAFGEDFQKKFLSLLQKDRGFSFQMLNIVKPEYFTNPYLKEIFCEVKDFVNEYSSCPTIDNLRIVFQQKGKEMTMYNKSLEEINTISLEDRDFVMKQSRDFCFQRHALIENEKARQLLLEGKFEDAKLVSFEAFKYGLGNTGKVMFLKKDSEKVFDSTKEHRPIPTPFPTFNDNMQGGPGAGNLVIMVAESNFGKSNALIAMSRHANINNKTVVFFSFEIGGVDMLRRHLAGLTKIRQEEIRHSKKTVIERVSAEGLGEFILIEERATNARLSVMKNHLEFLKSLGYFPDMICVDALNQLKLPHGMRYEGDNQKFEYLAEELRDWANEEMVPVYTVMQTNRSGFNSKLNDVTTIGKALEPFQVADVLITFSQDRPMAQENKCYAFLIKNRLGKKFILLECYYDPNMCVFEERAVVDDLMLLDEKEKEKIKDKAVSVREKLRNGEFDNKNKDK